ncbi:hypothetical protein F4679DRAFT_589313 [Xylaria curta]|nr:hypothetical protein F4679DRAFT_589313 [Xylaria curta]
MDAVSLGLSVAGVVGLFQNCLNLYGHVLSINDRDEEVRASHLLIQIELRTFRGLKDVLNRQLTLESQAHPVYVSILNWIEADLKRISELLDRHAARPADLSDDGSNAATSQMNKASKNWKRIPRSLTWIASDKQRLKELVVRLHQWNDGLSTFVPEVTRRRISFESTSSSIASNSTQELQDIEQATLDQYPVVSQRAAVKKLTLRSHGSLADAGLSLSGRARHKIPTEQLEWLPISTQRAKKTREPNATQGLISVNLTEASVRERAFAIYRGQPPETRVLVEWRENFRSEESLKQFEFRLDYIVDTLGRMSSRVGSNSVIHKSSQTSTSQEFNVLPCIGWVTTSPNFERVGLVFHLPQRSSPAALTAASASAELKPIQMMPGQAIAVATPFVMSLNDWIAHTRLRRLDAPALGQRFELAYKLALTLGSLLSVGWVHKEFRSHNILFSGATVDRAEGENEKLASGEGPYVAGFTYARPSNGSGQDLSLLSSNPVYELYRPLHPIIFRHQQKQLDQHRKLGHELEVEENNAGDTAVSSSSTAPRSNQRFANWTPAMDIYGLGIVLLEIGLWRTVEDLKGRHVSQVSFVSHVLNTLVGSLSYRMGVIYQDVVRRCLGLGEWVDNEDGVREFFATAIEQLSCCKA